MLIGRNFVELDVIYVAEHHDNLHHILAFLTISGTTPGVPLEAEVLDSAPPRLILRCASTISPPISLPAHTPPGRQDVRCHETHYEIKLSHATSASTPAPTVLPLLDATRLMSQSPTSFICASCSLPLVQSAKVTRYDDLPSEHWGELVDAWMCHSDQKLSEQVARHAKGFWPQRGQALVGGSYILFEESAVARSNLWTTGNVKVRIFVLSCRQFPSSLWRRGATFSQAWTERRPALNYPTNGRRSLSSNHP